MERKKKIKNQKRINKLKFFLVLILVGFMVQGLMIVNQNIIDLKDLENATIFQFNFKTKKLNLFGKSYIVDLKILKETN